VADLLRETFEIDGRLMNSLKLLFFRPGDLSLEFSANRRARYTSPVRLYLFTSILFFFVLALVTDVPLVTNMTPAQINTTSGEALSDIVINLDEDTKSDYPQLDPDQTRPINQQHIEAFKAVVSERVHPIIDELLNRDGYARAIVLEWAESTYEQGDITPSQFERGATATTCPSPCSFCCLPTRYC
jgi:hypothetical protein